MRPKNGQGASKKNNMATKNVLITGGAGFIGSNLAQALVSKGYEVTVLDNLSPQIHGEEPEQSQLYRSILGKVNFLKGDVRNRSDWEEALEGQQIVVHLAAETGTGQSMYEIEKYAEVNIKGTAILLDILANQERRSVEKIIIASSRAIYGEGKYQCPEHGIVYPGARSEADMSRGDFNVKCPVCGANAELLPTDEESKIHPTSIYGHTKQSQEDLCMIFGRALKVPVVAYRYQNVYGPGQSLSNPYTGILSIFSTRIRNGNDLNIFEDGQESRDFVYIDDVVAATILGIEKEEANYGIYNVGSGVQTSVNEVAQRLIEAYGTTTRSTVSGNFRLGDIRDNYADLSRISRELGYAPTVSFEEGIRRFTQWVVGQEIQEDSYSRSIEEMKQKGLLK